MGSQQQQRTVSKPLDIDDDEKESMGQETDKKKPRMIHVQIVIYRTHTETGTKKGEK